MRRVVYSFLIGFVIAGVVGIFPTPRFMIPVFIAAGFVFSLIINLLFFYIRRWDGCIEKLGGFTFTLFVLLATLLPLGILYVGISPDFRVELIKLMISCGAQIAVCGFVATCFLRTRNFVAPKPGEPFNW